MEDAKKSVEQLKQDNEKETPAIGTSNSKIEAKEIKHQSVTSTSSTAEQDLDVFLLGDLGDSDDGAGILYYCELSTCLLFLSFANSNSI